jgi:thiamine pyrophosphokinase
MEIIKINGTVENEYRIVVDGSDVHFGDLDSCKAYVAEHAKPAKKTKSTKEK